MDAIRHKKFSLFPVLVMYNTQLLESVGILPFSCQDEMINHLAGGRLGLPQWGGREAGGVLSWVKLHSIQEWLPINQYFDLLNCDYFLSLFQIINCESSSQSGVEILKSYVQTIW